MTFIGCLVCVAAAIRNGTFNETWQVISFSWKDLPSVPEIVRPTRPVLFGHYFGDFAQIVSVNQLPSPYVSVGAAPPSQYPPFAHFFLLPFGLVNLRVGWMLWATFSIGLVGLCLVRAVKRNERFVALLVVFASTPMLSSIDRGNLVIIAFAMMIVALSADANHSVQALWALVIAISLKPYLVIFALVLPCSRTIWLFASRILVRVAALNLGALILFQGNPIENLSGMVRAIVTAGQYDLGVYNHSAIALLPSTFTAAAFVLGYGLTVFLLVRPSQLARSTRVIFATLGFLAFSPQLPPYQLLFSLLLPLISLQFCQGMGNVRAVDKTLALTIFCLVAIPKQVAFSGFVMAWLDGFALLCGWFWMVLFEVAKPKAVASNAN